MDFIKQLPFDIQEKIYNEYLEKQREYHIERFNYLHNNIPLKKKLNSLFLKIVFDIYPFNECNVISVNNLIITIRPPFSGYTNLLSNHYRINRINRVNNTNYTNYTNYTNNYIKLIPIHNIIYYNKINNNKIYNKKYNNKIKYNRNRNCYPIKDTYRK